MAASIVFSKINANQILCQCLENRSLLSPFITQKRYKNKKQKLRVRADIAGKDGRSFIKREKKSHVDKIQTRTYDAEKPLDDVWISTDYPEPSYSLGEIITRHQEYAQPAMYNLLDSRIYADMDINMKTKKQTRFLHVVKNTMPLPHVFDFGMKRKCIVVCQEKAQIKLAEELGAYRAGGPEIIQMIQDGIIKKTDFDHLISVPGFEKEWGSLKGGVLREATPSVANGTLGEDIEKMMTFFLKGLSYETVKISNPAGKLTVPFGQLSMTLENLTENFKAIINDIHSKRPAGAPGKFISHMTIIAPPSPFRYTIQAEEYLPNEKKQTVKKSKAVVETTEEAVDSDSDSEEDLKEEQN